jgi:CopG family nickel-responsive transcriptional regulator
MLSRIGISLDEELLARFDERIAGRGYTNRSEAIRDMIREALVDEEWERGAADEERVAVVCLVYDHDEHDLGHRLTHVQHDHHDVVVSTMHVHMDRQNCLEVLILRGAASEIVATADSLVTTRGVKLGRLIPATTGKGL